LKWSKKGWQRFIKVSQHQDLIIGLIGMLRMKSAKISAIYGFREMNI
jgi:hypothetical protein